MIRRTRMTPMIAALALAGCGSVGATPAQDSPATPVAALDAANHSSKETNAMFRTLTDSIFVSPQIPVEAIAAAKQQGVTLIINNRPDGEDPSAPQGAEIEAAARAAGLDYVAIPVGHAGFSAPQVDAMTEALAKADASGGKALAYCRSGTRSTFLWALSEARKGESPARIAETAADAGYDVSPIRPMLDTLAGQTD